MKTACYALSSMTLGLVLCASVNAQAPANPPASSTDLATQYPTAPQGPVPLGEEPHHRLVLQNEFTHVYNVMVASLDSTLLHQHDLPYLYVTLGPADIINAVSGKPEAHQILQDGETHYSPGHFTHIVRTDSGMEFRNITIELVHPQSALKNLCRDVQPGAALDCPQKPSAEETASAETKPANSETKPAIAENKAATKSSAKSGMPRNNSRAQNDPKESGAPASNIPYFESDEVRVDLHKVSSGNDYVDATPQNSALLVALTDANLDANLAGEHVLFLHAGDVLWMPAGKPRRIVDFLGTHSGFLLIAFKDSTSAPSTQ